MKLKKMAVVFIAILFLGILTYLGSLYVVHNYDPKFLSIDSCLDNGGCWDSIDETCRKEEKDAQTLCERSQSIKIPPWIMNEKRKKYREKKIPMH